MVISYVMWQNFLCTIPHWKTLFEKFVSLLICLCLWKWTLVSNLSPCILLAERNQREITTEVKKVFRRLMSWRETLREQFCSTFQASRLLPPRILKFFRTFRNKEKITFSSRFQACNFPLLHYFIWRILRVDSFFVTYFSFLAVQDLL